MPASIRLTPTELLTAIRRREGEPSWIDLYRSKDNGKNWTLQHEKLVDTGVGNPPALLKLNDGRLALIYGYRAQPWSIRATLSTDNGATWSTPITLRDDGCSQDIGYPRATQLPNGKILILYYFCDPAHNPERYIAATLWTP